MVNPFKGSADAGAKKKSEEDGAAVGEDDGAGDDGAEGEEASKDKTRSYVKRSVYIFKTEDTVRARRSLARGTATIPQVEMMTMVSRSALNLPERQGKHYNTSNKGTVLGPVALTRPETEWQATVKDKREIYGKRFRIAVGGRVDGEVSKRRNDGDLEPTFFFTLPLQFFEELLHLYFVKSVIDLTPGSGIFGEAAIRNRCGYFCIAMSERHALELDKRFRLAALRFMCEEGCPVYNPKCAEAFGKRTATTTTQVSATGKAGAKAPGAQPAAPMPKVAPGPAPQQPPPAAAEPQTPAAKRGGKPKASATMATPSPAPPTPAMASVLEDNQAGSDWDFSDAEQS